MGGEGGRGSRSALLSDMDRQHFNRLATTGLMGLNLRPQVWLDLLSDQNPEVDGRRLNQRMSRLASFGANAAGGIDRVAFSDANIEALDWIAGLLVESGFSPSIDFAGNLIARKLGSGSELPPIMLGSHIDSVPGGGNYDGQVGSMGALEVAASLADAAHTTRHSLEILIFSNEEGGKTGSRALAGDRGVRVGYSHRFEFYDRGRHSATRREPQSPGGGAADRWVGRGLLGAAH